ncbi:hypothetical protein IFM89_004411 [Coptis chinensis]|uniref:Trichome birefringence-like C-terminal domain-containing protein n=1 Tax=Coptis chinensis TaxID=261450 RepID=A0A835IM23_9MAGN|nr:hypothetical protein IFM89_004411 [Coptis chinensis]
MFEWRPFRSPSPMISRKRSLSRDDEVVIHKMKVPVILLNVTRLTKLRKDGHPSIYGKNVTDGRKVSTRYVVQYYVAYVFDVQIYSDLIKLPELRAKSTGDSWKSILYSPRGISWGLQPKPGDVRSLWGYSLHSSRWDATILGKTKLRIFNSIRAANLRFPSILGITYLHLPRT